jgi:hypothetical protein
MLVKELIARLRQHPGDAEVLLDEGTTATEVRRSPLSRVLRADRNNATDEPIVVLHRAPMGVSRTGQSAGLSDEEYADWLGRHLGGRDETL